MALEKTEHKITEQEYLDGERMSDIRHEYIDGYVYAMAGASKNHERISGNFFTEINNHLKQKKSICDIFSSEMKAKEAIQSVKYFYPDILVTCDPHDNESEYCVNTPVIIVEVLSDSTRKYDKGIKKLSYFNISALQEYVIIEQDFCEVEVFRKNDDWRSTCYFLGDEIHLESIDFILSVEDIYYHVKNKDIERYLKEKK